MSSKVTGVVSKITKNNAGFWGVQVSDEWYGFGKNTLSFVEGDNISFEVKMNGKFKNADPKTVEKVVNSPSTPTSNVSANDRRQELIVLQSCQRNAIDLVKNLVEQGVVKLPTKVADKYQVYMEVLNEVHKELFRQVMFLNTEEVEQEMQGAFFTTDAEETSDSE